MSIYLMFDFQETELYYEEERVSNIDSLPLYEPKDVELPDYEMVEIISGDAPRYSQEVVPLEPLQVDAIESQEMVATEPIQDSGNAIESVVQAEPETEIEHIDLSVRQ
jgi:hypothetical protein